MNAQEMLLNYAKTHNSSSLTDQQFIGKAIQEGIRLQNNANGDTVIARIAREGKTIVVTETVKAMTVSGTNETTTEIFRVNV